VAAIAFRTFAFLLFSFYLNRYQTLYFSPLSRSLLTSSAHEYILATQEFTSGPS